jgi:MerR family copper efflux transcriptional regulator
LKNWMTIAELGRLAGVGVETVRYYQRLGLISVPSARDWRSHRRYGADAVAELGFVRACKELGFSLKEIALLVQLRRSPRSSCGKLHERLSELSSKLDGKWKRLASQRHAVRSLLAACDGGKPLVECAAFVLLAREESATEDAETVR